MEPLQRLLEKERILDRINELFLATDERAWPRVRACFTDDVMFDMSSMTGTPAQLTSSDELVATWQVGLAQLDAIHHQAGNYRVDVVGERATAFCYGIASHYRKTKSGKNTRTFVGSYDLHLVVKDAEWRIDGFKFVLKYAEGNLELEKDA
jgi:hypothetical protein